MLIEFFATVFVLGMSGGFLAMVGSFDLGVIYIDIDADILLFFEVFAINAFFSAFLTQAFI